MHRHRVLALLVDLNVSAMSITPKDKRDEVEWRALQARIRELEQENATARTHVEEALGIINESYFPATGSTLGKARAALKKALEALGSREA